MNRRRFLQGLGLAPAAVFAAPPVVSSIEVFRVPVNRRGDWILVRLKASNGLTGVGDASHARTDSATIELLRQFFTGLKGRSIFEVEWLRRSALPEIARRGQPAAVALSGLEQCLFDLQGQALGVPTYSLFGGALRTEMRNYANINRSTEERSPEGFARMAEKATASGFDAIKLAPFDDMPKIGSDPAEMERFTRLGIERAAAVRQAIGPKADLLIDAHSHFDPRRGLELPARMESLNLFWLEEVTPPSPLDHLAAINRIARMPTAGGESIYGVKGFLPYIAAGAVDITMPDVKYCGGMLELKKIAAVSEAAGLPIAPHGPASPVGNVAAAHVCASIDNFSILEFSFGEVPWRGELIEPAERLVKGMLTLADAPGFGIRLNDRMLAGKSV